VPDETEGFNFVSCLTSDTFWSIAVLFQRPFQQLVWCGLLGTTLLSTGFLLTGAKVLGKIKISVSGSLISILLNLIEVGVDFDAGKSRIMLNTLFALWLIMGLVLTNSYKGLIIAHLSVQWAPEQDYNYFVQLKGFLFYGPLPEVNNWIYWLACPGSPAVRNPSCSREFVMFNPFTNHALPKTYTQNYTLARTLYDIFDNTCFIYP